MYVFEGVWCFCIYVCVCVFGCVWVCVCVWFFDVCVCVCVYRVCGVCVWFVYVFVCVCVVCVSVCDVCICVCVCFLCCVYVCMCFGVCVCGCVLCVFMCVCLYFCVCHSSVSHLVCATFFFLYFCNSFLILTLLDLEIKSHFFYLNDSIPLCTCNLIIVMWRLFTTYKTVLILQLFKLGYLFRPLHGHHQANKEIVLIKVHSNLFFFLFFAGTQKSLIEINKEIARGVSILN